VGATGITGLTGANGNNGVAGATGTNGLNGNTGATGVVGATGITGVTGSNGANGNNGATGVTGVSGTNGINGLNGNIGATGVAGATGFTGATGASGCNTLLSYNSFSNILTSTDPCGSLTTTIPSVRIYAATGTTDISTILGPYVSTGLTLNFTATKSNALISFSISGRSDPTGFDVHQNVFGRVTLNGTPIGGAITPGQDLNATGVVTGWNISFSKPIVVTVGTNYTLVLQWGRNTYTSGVARAIYCEAGTAPDFSHRTITVMEY